MLKATKKALLRSCETFGLSSSISGSAWRRGRLLILAYHGISQEDEHLWAPELYMPPAFFRERLETIKRARCNVLPLAEALSKLYAGDLPERCAVLTFDDGASDFYTQALPILQDYGYPATVYLTTYYCDYNRPVFQGACSYILWKRRGARLDLKAVTGEAPHYDLTTEAAGTAAFNAVVDFAERERLSAQEKDELAARLARAVGFDYEAMLAKQLVHILSPSRVKEMAERGVDIQLHTHRHRSPTDRAELAREVEDNRRRIAALAGVQAEHLCYPDGLFHADYLNWLPEMGVRSATTCEPGLASVNSHPMALPRLVDTSLLSLTEFKGWLDGVSDFLPQRARRAAASR
ncbi:MAG TPA: polysaccharide deacetylase family protein [Blastocatellia bacterium]|nr:polysaccharide deacetylase family protein [Blastocatellia bacterium]